MKFFKNSIKPFFCFFCIGFLLNSITLTLNTLESRKNTRIKFIEKKNLKNQQEKLCINKTDYYKFFEMGFKETAKNRFILCMKEQNLIQ